VEINQAKKRFNNIFCKYYMNNNAEKPHTSRTIAEQAMKLFDEGIDYPSLKGEKEGNRIIVSLTTIPERLDYVHYAIESIYMQDKGVDKVVLWLDRSKIAPEDLPCNLTALQNKGLKINFVDDLGPHTKYFYALQEYVDDCVITIDDDIIYPPNLIESLWKAHCILPNHVCGLWVMDMKMTYGGVPYPVKDYLNVKTSYGEISKSTYIAQGVGGVLYPPKSIANEYLDEKLIRKLAFKQDDIYLKAVEVMSNTGVAKAFSDSTVYGIIDKTQKIALSKNNRIDGNDIAVNNVFSYFDIQKEITPYNEEKNDRNGLIQKWSQVNREGKNIAKYLIDKGIKTIAIYGMGVWGKELLQDIENSQISVKYGIDVRGEDTGSPIQTFSLNDDLGKVDAVIVTAPVKMQYLSGIVQTKIDCKCIALEDILTEMLYEMESIK